MISSISTCNSSKLTYSNYSDLSPIKISCRLSEICGIKWIRTMKIIGSSRMCGHEFLIASQNTLCQENVMKMIWPAFITIRSSSSWDMKFCQTFNYINITCSDWAFSSFRPFGNRISIFCNIVQISEILY